MIQEPFVRLSLYCSIRGSKDSGLVDDVLTFFLFQVKTVQVERQTLQEEHDRLMGRQSLLLQELASKEKG